jgi:Tol biopolymer transport system component
MRKRRVFTSQRTSTLRPPGARIQEVSTIMNSKHSFRVSLFPPNRPERNLQIGAGLFLAFLLLLWTGMPTPAGAQAVPGHLKIVFTSTQHANCPSEPGSACELDGPEGELYIMNRNGSDQTRITNDQVLELAAVWSPDGTKIAFYSQINGLLQIFLMNPDGTGLTQLTNLAVGAQFPDWSPDGTRIVFQTPPITVTIGGITYMYRDIFVINADGTGLAHLTHNEMSNIRDARPAWSPDGREIAFQSNRDGNAEIYVMDAHGSILRRLTFDSKFDEAPDWSPDGSKIVFQKRDKADLSSHSEIWVMNFDGTDPMPLTHTGSPARNLDPAWSPDGQKIAFDSDRDFVAGQIRQPFVMNADGTNQKPLTSLPGENGHAGWGWAADAEP